MNSICTGSKIHSNYWIVDKYNHIPHCIVLKELPLVNKTFSKNTLNCYTKNNVLMFYLGGKMQRANRQYKDIQDPYAYADLGCENVK